VLPYLKNTSLILKSNLNREDKMKKRAISLFMSLILLFSAFSASSLLFSCANVNPTPTSQRTYEAGAIGAGLGAIAGALIDKKNRWRGGVIGALIGGVAGATVSEISQRAAREAAYEGKPVVYQSNDGFQRVEATPVGYDANTKCHKVQERIWQEGKLVKDEVKEICESERREPGY
jgi:hypothetical protein